MRLTRVVVAGLAAVLIAAGGFGWYVANDTPQHRAPPSAQPAPQQPQPAPPGAQPRTPPQAGHRAPDTATPEHAKPRPDGDQPHASTRPPGDRPGRPIIIPYREGFGPWWGYPYGYPYEATHHSRRGGRFPTGLAPTFGWMCLRRTRQSTSTDIHVGPVDDFDGIFQHLTVTSGPHHIDIRKPEYVTLAVDVNLEPGQTITYKRTMEPKTWENLEFAP